MSNILFTQSVFSFQAWCWRMFWYFGNIEEQKRKQQVIHAFVTRERDIA